MTAGRKMKADQRALSTETAKTFVGNDGVVLRSSDQFVNHLYVWGAHVYRACVSFNPDAGSITISLAEPVDGVNCCKLVQSWWGPEAGGHPGIAGSPRGQELTWEDAETAAQKVWAALLLADDSSTQEK
jgi:hypothetical protein